MTQKTVEAICARMETQADDCEYFREACEAIGLEKLAEFLAQIARECQEDAAVLRLENRPKRRATKLTLVKTN